MNNRRISEILKELGVPASRIGYEYIKMAVKLTLEDGAKYRWITKTLYPAIAKEHNTTAPRVERAIRHAIETAFDRMSGEVMYRYFGNSINYRSGKATNSEFIAAIVEHIKTEEDT